MGTAFPVFKQCFAEICILSEVVHTVSVELLYDAVCKNAEILPSSYEILSLNYKIR